MSGLISELSHIIHIIRHLVSFIANQASLEDEPCVHVVPSQFIPDVDPKLKSFIPNFFRLFPIAPMKQVNGRPILRTTATHISTPSQHDI